MSSYRKTAGSLLLLFVCLLAVPCYGYADPTGQGLLYQLVGPIMALLATALAFFRRAIGSLFSRLRDSVSPGRPPE
jgi:hypothetical protein